jgi:hypothetical protein
MILIFLCGFYITVIAEIYTPEKIIKDKVTGYELSLSSMVKTTDNSQLLLGATQNDFTPSFFSMGKTPLHSLLIKLNQENQLDWAIEFDKYLLSDLRQEKEGGIVIVGTPVKEPLDQFVLINLEPNGSVVRSTLFRSQNSQKISAGKLLRVSSKDGTRIIIQVSTDSTGAQYGLGFLNIKNDGKIDSKKFFLAKDYKKILIKNYFKNDGISIYSGDIYEFNNDNADIFIICTDKSGQLSWAKVIYGSGDEHFIARKEIGDKVIVQASINTPQKDHPTPVYFLIDKEGNIDQLTADQTAPLDFPKDILKKDISPFLVKDVTITSFNVEFSSKAISTKPKKVKKITPQLINP